MKTNLHPELARVHAIWKQIKILKEGDRPGYESFMLGLPNESPQGKKERLPTFVKGFINPSGMLLRAKGDAVFKQAPRRDKLSAGQEAFVESADRSGQSLQELMHNEVAPTLAAYGTVFAVMDKPSAEVLSKEEELQKARPYLTILDPFQPVRFAYAKDGALLWFQYFVDAPEDVTDPFNIKRAWKADKGLATWTRESFSVRSPTDKRQFFVPETLHGFGFVPVIVQAQFVEPNKTIGMSTFFDTSDYLVMGNNLENASNQEVFKNANATLAIQEQDWDEEQQPVHERNPDSNLRVLNKAAHDFKNVFLYHEHKPEFLARELELIGLAGTRALRYFELAIDNEKNALSVGSLKTPQSGVAKAYDFADVNAMLSSFATAMERFERQAIRMAGDMLGEAAEFTVTYPKSFDVRSFNERLEFIKGLIAAKFPSKLGMQEAYKSLTPEITQDEAKQAEINQEIEAAKEEPAPEAKVPEGEPSPDQPDKPKPETKQDEGGR